MSRWVSAEVPGKRASPVLKGPGRGNTSRLPDRDGAGQEAPVWLCTTQSRQQLRHSSASATSRRHRAASQRVLAGQRGGQPAQVLQLLVECPREGLYRDVVRAGPVVFPDALGQ